VLKIPYWKAKDFASAFENNRFLKIEDYKKNLVLYKENLALYEHDQKRLKSLFWKPLAWVKLWIPSSKPSLPLKPILEPERSPDFQQCYDRCVKRLDRNRKAKSKSKPEITRITPKPDPSENLNDFLNGVFGKS